MKYIFANTMEIYEKIRNIRVAKGYTQEYIAEKLNIDTVNYGRLERGQTAMTIKKLKKIAEILEIDIADLFNDENQNTTTNFLLKKIYKICVLILKELKKINK